MSDERPDDLPRALRDALGARASRLQPATGAWERRRGPSRHRPRWVLPASAAAAVVVVAVVISVVASGHPDRGSQPPAAVAATSTPSGPASSSTTSGPTPSTPPAPTRQGETVVTATSAPLSPTPSAPITLVASSLLIRPDCAGTTTGCLQHPQRTFAADGSTSASAMGFEISDIGQGGATVSMDETVDGFVTFSNGITQFQIRVSDGPVFYIGSTPLLGGTGIWGMVGPTVTRVVITGKGAAKGDQMQLSGLSQGSGFVSAVTSSVHPPATVTGYDAAGHQLFSVQVTG